MPIFYDSQSSDGATKISLKCVAAYVTSNKPDTNVSSLETDPDVLGPKSLLIHLSGAFSADRCASGKALMSGCTVTCTPITLCLCGSSPKQGQRQLANERSSCVINGPTSGPSLCPSLHAKFLRELHAQLEFQGSALGIPEPLLAFCRRWTAFLPILAVHPVRLPWLRDCRGIMATSSPNGFNSMFGWFCPALNQPKTRWHAEAETLLFPHICGDLALYNHIQSIFAQIDKFGCRTLNSFEIAMATSPLSIICWSSQPRSLNEL